MKKDIKNRAVQTGEPETKAGESSQPSALSSQPLVTVRAREHLHEDGHRNPGDVFAVAPHRRQALGDSVEDVAQPSALSPQP